MRTKTVAKRLERVVPSIEEISNLGKFYKPKGLSIGPTLRNWIYGGAEWQLIHDGPNPWIPYAIVDDVMRSNYRKTRKRLKAARLVTRIANLGDR
jgi:hypothetical protein